MQCLVANAVQTFLIENPLGILSQNKDRIRIYLQVLVSTWGPTIGKSLNYIILVIMVLLPLIYYLVVYSINNFWALSLWQTLFYTLEIQWQTRDQDLLLWKESGNQEMFWWSKYQFLRMSRKGYLQCRKICFRCTPEPGFYSNPSFRFSWLEWYNQFPIMVLPVTSVLISAMYYHLCFLVLWLVHLRQVFPKVFTMKTSTLKVPRSPTIKILFNLIYKGFFKLILTANCASSHHSPNAMPWYLLSTTF